jgi:hypothetical protein
MRERESNIVCRFVASASLRHKSRKKNHLFLAVVTCRYALLLFASLSDVMIASLLVSLSDVFSASLNPNRVAQRNSLATLFPT